MVFKSCPNSTRKVEPINQLSYEDIEGKKWKSSSMAAKAYMKNAIKSNGIILILRVTYKQING